MNVNIQLHSIANETTFKIMHLDKCYSENTSAIAIHWIKHLNFYSLFKENNGVAFYAHGISMAS